MTRRIFPRRRLALLLAPPLFWAGNAVVARALVGDFPPLALSFARWALALLLVLPFALRGLRESLAAAARPAGVVVFAISALGVGCYNSLQYLALQTSTAVNATLIGASAPISTCSSVPHSSAPVRASMQWLGAALSLLGVLLVIARGDPMNLARLQLDRGDLIMLVATLSWSLYTWLLRTRRPAVPAAPFLALQIALGALMILPFALRRISLSPARRRRRPAATSPRCSMSRCCRRWSPTSAGIAASHAPGPSCRCTSST